MWDGLVDIWATEEWKKKSTTGKSNRAAKPDAMIHTAGSRSFEQHLIKMVFLLFTFEFISQI